MRVTFYISKKIDDILYKDLEKITKMWEEHLKKTFYVFPLKDNIVISKS